MKKINLSLVASFLLATNLYSQETTKLSEITVTSATKSEQKLKDITANVDVITAEDIEARKFTTVIEALNSLSGISISTYGGIGQAGSMYLRGMDSGRTLVLVDGIRYNDPSGFGANFEHLMINDIERIEVIKGAQSSIWGAEASAGVINIITKSAQKGTHGSVNLEFGRYDTKIARANISHKTDDFDTKLSLVRVDTDGFSAMSPKSSQAKNYENDAYENTSANIKLGYNLDENNRISTSYEVIDTKVDFDSTPNDKISKANTLTHLANLIYENKNDFAVTKIYANYTDIKREYTTNTPRYKGIIQEYGVNTSIDYLSSSNLVLGADYKKFENKANLEKDYNNKAIFISNTNKFFDDKTIFTQALRYDRYSDFDNKTTGKIGIKQYIIDDLNISLNYGTGYNVPTFEKLFSPTVTFPAWQSFNASTYLSNPDLSPEKTKSYDVSIEYKGFSVTYFKNKVNNLISSEYIYTVANTDIYQQQNISGNTVIKGTEIAYKNEVIKDTFLNLGYTNLSAKDKNGNKLLNRPSNKFNFGVDYYGLKDFHFNINGEYIGSRKAYGNVKTGNYTVWNAVIDYQANKNFSTYIKLDNMFNKDYQIVDGYATSQRAAYLGIKASF
ncbi:TonB-dependent receptor plug domain-containing protein [Arcobacter porcinus]|uniref:TonB-dependent receptor plug domain-containing protein n=1 Tax=Arcobacter porcinus TaxID=1935204 RepID=UPI0008246B18|nr:TonB-dependent receptor [Arcobacter porcinus]OCL85096.1 Vitamin B12 transporter BtuB precursor [Arcobacter porcinus]OCL86659.1 Vitamin B12 transporter BtuB precursor [Arcobacter porcinus]